MSSKDEIEVPNHFEVEYRFLSEVEGGRKDKTVYQGYRPDWSYDGDDVKTTGIYMIWPIFVNDNGEVFRKGAPVPSEGLARMLIVTKDQRLLALHKERLQVGTRGYFMEGPRRVATAEVVRIIELENA